MLLRQIIGLGITIISVPLVGIPAVVATERALAEPPQLTHLTSIYGTPYSKTTEGIMVTEQLAHADIELSSASLGQVLLLQITFEPGSVDILQVGVRENPFWLSYENRLTLFDRRVDLADEKSITREVVIPLSDKIVDRGSVDLMFWASSQNNPAGFESTTEHTSEWVLVHLSGEQVSAFPSWQQTKDWIRSVLARERAL